MATSNPFATVRRWLRIEPLEDRRMLTSTGVVPILHILAEVGPQDYHNFHPDHNVEHYQSVLTGSGNDNKTINIAAVNYSDAANGAEGHFSGDTAFPGNEADNFVLDVTAFFYVSTGQVGEWTFGVRSDDGSRLRIDGQDVIIDDGTHAARDSFGAVALTEGLHSLDLVYFEKSGGASLELFAAPGLHTSFNTNFSLFSNSVFSLDGPIELRQRASDINVSTLADADALLAEPYHNIVDYFNEVSNGQLQLTPATAGDLDGSADGIVGPYEFATTITDVQ